MSAARVVLVSTGGDFLGRVNSGNVYVRIAPHTERTVSIGRFWDGVVHGRPFAAFRGNYSQRDVMQEVRRRLRKYRDFRFTVRNAPSFNVGGGSFDIDFVLRGPDLEALAEYGERLRRRAEELGGILDGDTTLKLEKPELRVHIDRHRAADLNVDVSQV